MVYTNFAAIAQSMSLNLVGWEVKRLDPVEGLDGTYIMDVTARFQLAGMDFLILFKCKRHMTWGRIAAALAFVEEVVEDEPGPIRDGLVGEYGRTDRQHVGRAGESEVLDEVGNVFGVAAAAGEDLHGEEVLGGGRGDAEAGVVKDVWGVLVAAPGRVGAGLLVEPPTGQAEFVGDCPRFFEDHAVGLEDGVDVAGGAAGVVGKGHGSAADDVDIGDDAPAGKSLAKAAEGVLDSGAVEKRVGLAHATSSSWGET